MRAPSFKIKFLVLSLAWVGWLIAMGVLPIATAQDFNDIGVGQGVVAEPMVSPAAPSAPGGPAAPSAPAAPGGPSAPIAPTNPGGPAAPSAPSRPVMQPVRLENPLSGINSIPELLAAVLNVFIIIAIPIIIFFIMLAGFKYVTARGNPDEISKASQALLYAIIGAVLVIGSTAIAQILKNLVNAFRS
jgi:Type IV secretion system pilin